MPNYSVDVTVTTKSDDKGIKEVQQGLDKVTSSAKQTSESLKHVGDTSNSLKSQVSGLIGEFMKFATLGFVIKLFKDGFTEAVNHERSMKLLTDETKRYGITANETAESVERLRKYFEQAGDEGEKSIDMFRKMITLLKDAKQAESAVALAEDLSKKANMSVEEAYTVVEHVVLGTRRYQKEVKAITGKIVNSQEEGLASLEKFSRGYAATLDDTKAKLDAQKVEIQDAIRNISDAAKGMLDYVLMIFKGLQATVQGVVTAFMTVGEAASGAMNTVGRIAKMSPWEALTKGTKVFREEQARTKTAILDLWSAQESAWKDIFKTQKKVIAEGSKIKPLKAPSEGGGGETGLEGAEALEKELRNAKLLEEYFNRVIDKLPELRRPKIDIFGDAVSEAEELENNFQKMLRASKLFYTDTSKMSKKELAEFKKKLKEELAAYKKTKSAEEMLNEKDASIVIRTNQEKVESGLQMASQITGMAQKAFGDNKAIQSAAAVINTAEAVTGALGNKPWGPWNIALAAMVGALGLAEIMKINSTDAKGGGGGFDNPSNDAMAYQGGQRWAADMINQWSMGIDRGWAAGMTGSSSVTNNSTSNITHRGGDLHIKTPVVTGATAKLVAKQLAKELRVGERFRNRGRITNGA